MSEHLSEAVLSALADGELGRDQLAGVHEHLAACPPCTSSALMESLLKSSTAKAGQRYTVPPQLRERLSRLAAHKDPQQTMPSSRPGLLGSLRSSGSLGRLSSLGWAVAAVLLFAVLTVGFFQRSNQRLEIASAENTALVTEACDQHIATLASSLSEQVISSDRHTVKPWFQGKIPFSFNLPENLPRDTTLDGANLTYLRNRPVAQLLYSIGKHRVSVFVGENIPEQTPAVGIDAFHQAHSGFHLSSFSTDDLEFIAVSDVDPARLADLLHSIQQSQAK